MLCICGIIIVLSPIQTHRLIAINAAYTYCMQQYARFSYQPHTQGLCSAKVKVKEEHEAAVSALLMMEGVNSYEVHRQKIRTEMQKVEYSKLKEIIDKDRERLLKQLVCEKHAWSKELKAALQKQVCKEVLMIRKTGESMYYFFSLGRVAAWT